MPSNTLGKKYLIGACIFLISFIIYFKTLSPTISWGDSGEFIVVAQYLGIAHPTGYPLYILLGKLFTFLPIGSIAYRINFMSAFFASCACSILFFVVFKLTKNVIVSGVASLILACSYTFWSQAIIAEVYTLHIFFMMLLLLVLLIWKEKEKNVYLYVFSFLYGLSLCNHLVLSVVLLPGFIYFILIHKQNSISKIRFTRITLKIIVIMIVFFLLGLLPYVYLPIRSLQQPNISSIDFTHIGNIIKYARGGQFTQLVLKLPSQQIVSRIFSFFYYIMLRELSFIGFVCAILGIMYLYKKQKVFCVFTLILFLTNFIMNIIYPINLNLDEIWVWYIPIYAICVIYIAFGLEKIIHSITNKKAVTKKIVTFLCIVIPLLLFISNYAQVDKSQDYSPKMYADTIFRLVKNNSIIVTRFGGDDTDTLLYLQIMEGKRQDVYIDSSSILIEKIRRTRNLQYTTKISQEEGNSLLYDFIKQNIEKHPIYFINKPPQDVMKANNFSNALVEIKQKDLINQTVFFQKRLFVY